MNILIAGGTGLIGRALSRQLVHRGHMVKILTRSNPGIGGNDPVTYVVWDGRTAAGWEKEAKWADAFINLAGENIGANRWSDDRKLQILESRLDSGKALLSAIEMGANPRVFIQASAVGYYGTSFTQTFYERSKAGKDFLARVCVDWEDSTSGVETRGIRRIVIRTGVVLDQKEGALARMLLPFKFFVGGPLGNGRQWLSWIHLEDEVGAIIHLLEDPKAKGVYNLTAPQPVTNAIVGRTIGKLLHRPYWLPVPAFALKTLLGEMSTLVLDGQRVVPDRLTASGYHFKFDNVADALQDILKK